MQVINFHIENEEAENESRYFGVTHSMMFLKRLTV
jgi:hypothetical protein